jgi:predicted RNA methylase
MSTLKETVKKITPEFILRQRKKYYQKKRKRRLDKLRQDIIHYLEHNSESDMPDEKQKILDYLKHNAILPIFPYEYTKNYKPENVTVYEDSEKEIRYVLQEGKRLYFKRNWDEKQIREYYNGLLIEQDKMSPHRYETPEFHVSEGDTVIDAGVAEGNFALSIVDKVKKLYLFEADEEWIEVLKITFAPWKEKVVIVNKYVSDNDNNNCVTLDKFFGQEKIDFIKADIEGAESLLLTGAKTILSGQSPMKIILCTYHKHNDADILNRILKEKGFHIEFSKGYMIFLHETYDKLKPPYLRRGLIRAVK